MIDFKLLLTRAWTTAFFTFIYGDKDTKYMAYI